MSDSVSTVSDITDVSTVVTKRKLPGCDGDGKSKCTRAPNWQKDEEECLIQIYVENQEALTAELKGASGKSGKHTAEAKDHIWQEITN